MNVKNLKLSEAVKQKFRDTKAARFCLVLNSDEFSGKLLYEEDGDIYLKRRITLGGRNAKDQILEGIEHQIRAADSSIICDELYSSFSDFNSILRRYIVSNRIMNNKLLSVGRVELDCGTVEKCLSICKASVIKLIELVAKVCSEESIDDNDLIIFIIGKAADIHLIKHYYLSELSYDPNIADSRIAVLSAEAMDEEFTLKEVKHDNVEKSSIHVLLTLQSDQKVPESIEANIFKSDDEIKDYIGPIFIATNENLNIEIDGELYKVNLPYSTVPIDCDLIEVGFFLRDNKESYVRIKRCQHPDCHYDVLLKSYK